MLSDDLDVLLQGKDILSFQTLVSHLVHDVLYDEYAESSNFAFFSIEGDVGIFNLCLVKFFALVGDGKYECITVARSHDGDVSMKIDIK